jgi:hypothetical protein
LACCSGALFGEENWSHSRSNTFSSESAGGCCRI